MNLNGRKYPACLSACILLYPPLAGCHRITATWDFVFLSGCFSEFPTDMSYNSILSLWRARKWAHEQIEPYRNTLFKPLNVSDYNTASRIQSDDSADEIMEKENRCFANISPLLCLSVCYVITSGENRTGVLSLYSRPADYSWLDCQNIRLLTQRRSSSPIC